MGDAHHAAAGARALAARMLERTEEVADAVCARVTALIPAYAERVPAAELRRSVAEHYRVVFEGMVDPALVGDAPADPAAPAPPAAEGVPMSALFEAYQIFLSSVWEHLADVAEHDEVPPRTAVRAASELWRRLSGGTGVLSDGYRSQLEARIRSHEQRRSALVQALLEGRLPEPRLGEAADMLRLPHSGPYVVIAARVAAAGEHGVAGIEDELRALSITSAWRLLPDVEIGLASLPQAGDQLDQLVRALAAGSVGRVGVSPLFDDLTGTAGALELARIALRGAAGTGEVVVFGRDSLSVAAASAPDVMSRLSHTILSGLEPMSAEDRAVLLDTFGAWLNHGGSADEAARRLYVHPNTVRYRLRRLEERTGRTLSDPRHLAELSLAFEVDRGRTGVLAEGESGQSGAD
jgi:hypothetical protein